MQKIEYRVRPVTRYIVTRYYETAGGETGGSATKGDYESAGVAYEVAYALCKAEHEQLGWPIADERILYPMHPQNPNVEVAHADCAQHSMPAYPNGPCSCGNIYAPGGSGGGIEGARD